MRIILGPMGTDGDIRPFIALGKSLIECGNDILMVIPKNAIRLCDKYKMPYRTLDFDYRDFVSAAGRKNTKNEMITFLDRQITEQFLALREVADGADLLIGSAVNYATSSIAELYNIPYYQVWHLVQVFKSLEHPPWRVTIHNKPHFVNRIFWGLSDMRDNAIGRMFIDKNRKEIGLKPIKDYCNLFRKNVILAADKNFVSVPDDVVENYTRTDYWHLFEDDELDKDLVEFINAGTPPVYFGFGSMIGHTPMQTACMIEDIAKSLNIRIILQKGWASLGGNIESARVKVIDSVPHHKLFPKMCAVIHHGGSGTTHTAALAGVPQIIIPNIGDQFYWGNHVYKLNLGPKPLIKKDLTPTKLKNAIEQAVSDTEISKTAKETGNRLKDRNDMDSIVRQLKLK